MKKRRNLSRSLNWFSFGIVFVMATLLFAPVSHADETMEPGALTLPPPKTEAAPSALSVNPNNKLLYESQIYNFEIFSSKAKINVLTTAYKLVDRVGADVYLQRWSGNDWVTVQSSNLSAKNSRGYYGVSEWNAEAGYYYRVTSVHYAQQGTVREEYRTTSASMLYPKQ